MRTPLVWTLRVTISPWNSLLPTFLKEPILAMSLLLAVSSPRPPRPRWRSTGRGRSTTHPLAGRSAAEDGGGETFLPREEWAKPRGRKSIRRRCGSGDRGAAALWPDRAGERPCGSRDRTASSGEDVADFGCPSQTAQRGRRRERNYGVREGVRLR